jgi:hypothetical protein
MVGEGGGKVAEGSATVSAGPALQAMRGRRKPPKRIRVFIFRGIGIVLHIQG